MSIGKAQSSIANPAPLGLLGFGMTTVLLNFLTLAVLFFMLAIGDFTGSAAIKNAAGWVGIVCGASAVYNSVAQVINNEYGKKVLPL